jgi:2-keto-4-pentenoate hydratase/2-oxohepta-3-ene-1,7-dioic acid hydratase in catechol pathway
MITPIPKLLSEISHWFSLEPGDVVLTGTPAGVAELQINDQLEMTLDNQYSWTTTIYAK